LNPPLKIEQGHFRIPGGPGLGIEINEEKNSGDIRLELKIIDR